MNRSIKELLNIFNSPRSYRILISDSSEDRLEYIDLKDPRVEITRHNDAIEILDSRCIEARLLITIPITIGALERCQTIANRLKSERTALLTRYEICSRAIASRGTLNQSVVAQVVIQRLPKGEMLSQYIVNMRTNDITSLYNSVERLKSALKSSNISFRALNIESIIIDKLGFLYPFRYKDIQFNQDPSSYCRDLHRHIADICGDYQDEDQPSIEQPPYADHLDIYDDHISCGTPHEDRIVVVDATGYGYIDSSGEPIIPSIYLWADNFKEGRAEVQSVDGFGLIDTDGRAVIPLNHSSVSFNLHTGVITACKGDKWGYFAYSGEQLTPYMYDHPDEDITLKEISSFGSHDPKELKI